MSSVDCVESFDGAKMHMGGGAACTARGGKRLKDSLPEKERPGRRPPCREERSYRLNRAAGVNRGEGAGT